MFSNYARIGNKLTLLLSVHQVWSALARVMGPLMAPAAAGLADLIASDQSRLTNVLDVLASHRICCNVFATKNREAQKSSRWTGRQ